MTRVLALDLATNTGVAVLSPQGSEYCGSLDYRLEYCRSWNLLAGVKTTGKSAPPLDVRHVLAVKELKSWIAHAVGQRRPDVIAIERDFGRGSGTRFLVSLYTAAQEAAYDAGLPCLGVRLGDWRRAIHGSAGWSTEKFKAEAIRLVPIAAGDADAAEAALIGRYVAENIRINPVAAPATASRKRAA